MEIEWITHECKCVCGQVHRMEIQHREDGKVVGLWMPGNNRMTFIKRRKGHGVPIAVRCWDCMRRILVSKFKAIE